ncbi:MAG: hypothetical protein P4L77_04205 [Sulfuriferula sp.]|nr:hypothetical protein [Sulfuriferula sp.]
MHLSIVRLLAMSVLGLALSDAASATTVTASPTSCASVTGIGTVAWTNPDRAVASDSSYATASVDGTTTRYLECTGYGFAIPASAIINGITVTVTRKSSSTSNGGSSDAAMRLVQAGAIGTTDRSTTTIYTTSNVSEAHGGSADLWGSTWTPADINATNFGAAFAADKASTSGSAQTVSVDYIEVTVDYTVPFSCTPPSNIPAGVAVSCQCDSFNRTTLNPSTIFGANWIVSTSDSTGIVPSIVNPGYLRLTNNTGNNAKAATVPGIFPAAGNYISVEFQQYAYNGSGADGIAMTLSDYSIPAVPGAYGGSLGYAQETGKNGFAGGWLGVALDEYGNYQNPTEGRLGGPGFISQSVGVRGSGSGTSGYRWLGGTSSLTPLIDNRTSTTPSLGYFYQVIVDARNDPTSTAISVNRDTGAGYAPLISIPNVYAAAISNGFTQDAVPSNWQISFTGSTGGSTNIHEISNVRICATSMWSPSGGTASGFNAIDEAYGTPPSGPAVQSFLSGHIYTKLVGSAFKLNVAALSNNQIQTAYVLSGSKAVTVKLVDNSDGACVIDNTQANYCNSACTNKAAVTGGSQVLTFTSSDAGKKLSGNFTLNSAYRNLVAVISDGTVNACSTDAFSVRPASVVSVTTSNATNTATTGTPVFKAGSTNFSLTAVTAGISGYPDGYNGVLKINNATVQPVSPATVAGTLSGTFPAAVSGTAASTATANTLTYSEVGAFYLPGYDPNSDTTSLRGVFDGVATATECTAPGLTQAQCDALKAATWTGVDSISSKGDCVADSYANVKNASGKYGCNFGLAANTTAFGRFIPDHFVLTGGYMGNRADLATTGNIASGSSALTVASVANIRVGGTLTVAGAGASGGALSSTVIAVNSGSKVVTLAAAATTTVSGAYVLPDSFTYMDEPLLAGFTLTAQNASGGTTQNYTGSLAKLDGTVAANWNWNNFATSPSIGPGAVNATTPLTARLSTAVGNPVGSFVAGVGAFSAQLTLTRLSTAPDGPYPTVQFGVAPQDSDGVKLASFNLDAQGAGSMPAAASTPPDGTTERALLGNLSLRFGRLWLGNAYGSEKSSLSLPYEVQYWNGLAFVKNTADYATALTAANFGLGNYKNSVNATNLPATALTLGTYSTGSGSVTLAAPNASGSADVVAILGSPLNMCTVWTPTYPSGTPVVATYLRGNWCGGSYVKDPAVRATFGIFGSSSKKGVIYLRESY